MMINSINLCQMAVSPIALIILILHLRYMCFSLLNKAHVEYVFDADKNYKSMLV